MIFGWAGHVEIEVMVRFVVQATVGIAAEGVPGCREKQRAGAQRFQMRVVGSSNEVGGDGALS